MTGVARAAGAPTIGRVWRHAPAIRGDSPSSARPVGRGAAGLSHDRRRDRDNGAIVAVDPTQSATDTGEPTVLAGRYRLDAQVGSGGMSTVWRAFDEVLERTVAIKSMLRSVAGDSQQLERFRREARAVAQLNHPHIVQVIDVGEDRKAPFIVFEYVAGETLKARIRRLSRLEVTEALAYAIEIARALEAAHDKGIVHRDVKPQNVLIDEDGRAKVTDFGIARTLEEDGLTADGRVLGTTDYVSPEQALGKRVGPQSDLYSLGIVLYEMLVGDVPFKGENQVAVAMRHVREEIPDVRLLRPGVSVALAQLLDRLTAKDPAKRPASAAAAIADLEDVLAIESSRSGVAPGEATEVLKSLPKKTRNRIPLRSRFGKPSAGLIALFALLGVIAIVVVTALTINNAERGTGVKRGVTAPVKNEKEVSIGQTGAEAYDPFGTGDVTDEHAEEAPNIVDGNPETTWSTEGYRAQTLAPKPGVGIIVDAKPGVKAASIEIQSETTGWSGAIFAAPNGSVPSKVPGNGWVKAATVTNAGRTVKIPLDGTASKAYRYFLVWITALPPEQESVALREVVLYRLEAS
ncbi:MAG: serine/threonine protein kinase [Solirubrobacteraceae bacterium]|nr:serine/threonine protein kinase [Solirubrobacteraceae bacterium]